MDGFQYIDNTRLLCLTFRFSHTEVVRMGVDLQISGNRRLSVPIKEGDFTGRVPSGTGFSIVTTITVGGKYELRLKLYRFNKLFL